MRFIEYLQEQALLLEARIDFLKQHFKGISTAHDPDAEHQDSDAIVDHFANNADPSPTKKHTQWIMGMYKNGLVKQSDHPRINELLTQFDRHHSKLENKQLSQFRSLDHMEETLAPHINEYASNRERKKAVKDDGSEIVHEQGGVVVRHLKTEAAACLYGRGTDWCTAYTKPETPNQFNYYNSQGPVYIIHHDNRKYQFHHESGQFNDEANIPVKLNHIHPDIAINLATSRHPDIAILNLKEKNPHLTSDTLRDLFNSPRATTGHKMAVVYHPNVPADIVDSAVSNDNYGVRAAAASAPHLTDDHKTALSKDDYRYVQDQLSYRKDLAPHHVSNILNGSPELSTVKRLGQTYDFSSDDIHKMIQHNSRHVNRYGLEHKNATDEHIMAGLKSPSGDIRFIAAQSARTPEHISIAMKDNHEGIRRAAAGNPNASSEQIFSALNDTSHDVRRSAIFNPSLSPEHVSHVLNDPDEGPAHWSVFDHPTAIRPHHVDQVLNNPNSSESLQKSALWSKAANEDHFHKAISSPHPSVKMAGWMNIVSPTPEQFDQGLNEPDEYIRREVAGHPSLNGEQLFKALTDKSSEVRYLAYRNPNVTDELLEKARLARGANNR